MGRRTELYRKKQQRKAKLCIFIVGAIIGALVVVGATYFRAIADLDYCEQEGWETCELEYDGLAYGWHIYYK